jgi:hypothetical protein
MQTIEVYVRNPEEIRRLTSFLQENHFAFTKKGSVILDEATFYTNYVANSRCYVTPTPEFASLCGREYLNKEGQIHVTDIFTFLCTQLKNSNCFFLEQLMDTKEYLAAVPK